MADVDDFVDDMEDAQEDLDALEDEAPLVPQIDDPFELLYKHHPETILDYAETIVPEVPLQQAPPSEDGKRDTRHRSPPFLTIYERTKILGSRANQLAEPPVLRAMLPFERGFLQTRGRSLLRTVYPHKTQ